MAGAFTPKNTPVKTQVKVYSADTSLLAGDAGTVQLLAPTATQLSVTLPPATSVPQGYQQFQLQNETSFETWIKDNAGRVLANIGPNGGIDLHQQSGEWLASGASGLKQSPLQAGSAAVFESAAINASNSAVAAKFIDSTRAVICYNDVGNSNYGTACVLTLSGLTITPGTPVVFESAATTSMSLAVLDSTNAIVCYQDGGNANYGTACMLTISGTTITPGTPAVYESAQVFFNSCIALSSTKAIVCYRDSGNSDYGTACVLDISGATITPGTPTVFDSVTTNHSAAVFISSTRILVSYAQASATGRSRLLNISGTTISSVTSITFQVGSTSAVSAALISPGYVLICASNGTTDVSYSYVVLVSGDAIRVGAGYAFKYPAVSYASVAVMSPDSAVVFFYDTPDAFGAACHLSIKKDAVIPGELIQFSSGAVANIGAASTTQNRALVCYADATNSNYGTAKVAALPVFG